MTPDAIISISGHTTVRLREAGFKREITTIPLGIDFDLIRESELSREKNDVIVIGRLLPHKNADMLIKAIGIAREIYPGIRCKIVGSGPEKENLEKLVKGLKLEGNVEISGNIEKHSDLYGFMKSSKMLVLPSTREGFGLVVIEANACGLPVITIDCKDNAAKDLVLEGVNGFVTRLNEADIAKKIVWILRDHGDFNLKTELYKYDWNVLLQTMKAAYSVVTGRKE